MPEGVDKKMPERLLPAHVGGPIETPEQTTSAPRWEPAWKRVIDAGTGLPVLESAREPYSADTLTELKKTSHEAAAARQEALWSAPDLEGVLQNYLKEQGKEVPEDRNLSLIAIEEFQRRAKEAQDLRRVARLSKDPVEKAYASLLYGEKKKQLDEYLGLGLPFEKAYREYIKAKNDYLELKSTLKSIHALEASLNQPAFSSFKDSPEAKKIDDEAYGRLESVVRQTEVSTLLEKGNEIQSLLGGLKLIYPEDSAEYQSVERELLKLKPADLPKNKKEIIEQIGQKGERAAELWDNPMVRRFWFKRAMEELQNDFAAGKDVLETPDVTHHLNELHDWETYHQRTTIGGVLVGDPGVGKTTLVRYYLELKHRGYVYIDLSEDVTRFMLYGSKSLEFKSAAEAHQNLTERLEGLDDESFRKLISENSQILQDTLGIPQEEAVVVAVTQLEEAAGKVKSLVEETIKGSNVLARSETIQEFMERARYNIERETHDSPSFQTFMKVAEALKGIYPKEKEETALQYFDRVQDLLRGPKATESQTDTNLTDEEKKLQDEVKETIKLKTRKYMNDDELDKYLRGTESVIVEGNENGIKYIEDALRNIYPRRDGESSLWYFNRVKNIVEGRKETSGQSKVPETAENFTEMQQKIKDMAGRVFRGELAQEFAHLVKKNGWRDGVIISALRRGDSVIFDEFNKNKNWSLIFGLLTAKPGEEWYFADNDEYIHIPDTWRMYFTANIERKHGGFEVAEALASRAEGKVMEMSHPKSLTEMLIGEVALANTEGDFLRSNDDLAKLYTLIFNAFPDIRNNIAGERQVLPISYRTIRDIAEKLVVARDPKTGIPVYQATDKTFDQAVYEVIVGSYGLYESKVIPTTIVSYLTTVGLLLDDSVKDLIVPRYITQETYDANKKAHDDHKEDFSELLKKLKGMKTEAMTAMFIPESRKF
ncbi:MAG: AAA family ATPase [Candidatus Daviesbacteria bacterium]|nr:AAA family ATPase [Candidatus Daviesbacteria bacterium]